ncbi:MAG TPA: DUF4388 domain-containing protein [Oculatellaceae cyanobacterium]
MRSSGFGLGKKPQSNEPKRQPPTSADLTQLLTSCRKAPDKIFSFTWVTPNKPNSLSTLTVMAAGSQRGDRRGWSGSAADNAGGGDAEWKLTQDNNGVTSVVFAMRSSDAYLIHTLLDEAAVSGSPAPIHSATPAAAPEQSYESEQAVEQPTYGGAAPKASTQSSLQEGSLRQLNIRKLLESYNEQKTTGRLIVDLGNLQTEVFLASGEPVHAKCINSLSQSRDTVGDAVLIELLTWKDGTFKLQEGWPAASKSISSPLHMFLSGSVTVPDPAVAAAAAATAAAPATTNSAAAPAQSSGYGSTPAPMPTQSSAPAQPAQAPAQNFAMPGGSAADDFGQVDDLIGSIYPALIEPSGLLKYGMLLMLVKSEFVRQTNARNNSFCFASVGVEPANGAQLTDAALGKIGERFEKVCRPLDTIAYAGNSRFYILLPQHDNESAHVVLKNFINNVLAIPLDTGLHGSSMAMTVGLAEVPRDGTEFQQVFNKAGGLRTQATKEKKIVSSSF